MGENDAAEIVKAYDICKSVKECDANECEVPNDSVKTKERCALQKCAPTESKDASLSKLTGGYTCEQVHSIHQHVTDIDTAKQKRMDSRVDSGRTEIR